MAAKSVVGVHRVLEEVSCTSVHPRKTAQVEGLFVHMDGRTETAAWKGGR
jgi:hypothetical protein